MFGPTNLGLLVFFLVLFSFLLSNSKFVVGSLNESTNYLFLFSVSVVSLVAC